MRLILVFFKNYFNSMADVLAVKYKSLQTRVRIDLIRVNYVRCLLRTY